MSEYDFDEYEPEASDEKYDVRESQMDLDDTDPFADWFMPGYVTEMDYMNAMEADDYRDELSDLESDDLEF